MRQSPRDLHGGTPPEPQRRRGEFRSDLEGLRAVAVLFVVLYHASLFGLTGGFVGVDIFYVLSGFFITRLLLREHERSGCISLVSFYARRIRRLLPAAMVVVVATVAVAYFILPPLAFAGVGGDTVAATLYYSNIHFAEQATNYLQSTQAPSPLLHYWSLGVEEQFYLVWPALMMLVLWRARSARRALLVLGSVFVVSLVFCIWETQHAQPWAFFLLPSRAWELAAGGLLAVGAARLGALPARIRGAGGWLGVALLALAGFLLDQHTAFPGYAAVLPVAGTALVVAAGEGVRFSPARVLQTRPLRAVGRWSYSIYLWHWPLLIFLPIYLGRNLAVGERLAAVVISVALGAFTFKCIETPLRYARLVSRAPRRAFALGLALTTLGMTAGLALAAQNIPSGSGHARYPTRRMLLTAARTNTVPANLSPSLGNARRNKPRLYTDGCHLSWTATTSPRCVFGDPKGKTRVVLFGDSHAADWFAALVRIANQEHWRLESLTKSSCAAVATPLPSPFGSGTYTQCTDWHRSVLARIARERPDLVVVASYFPAAYDAPGQQWAKGWRQMLLKLHRRAHHVLALGDTPRSQFDVPVCLSGNMKHATACTTPRAQATVPAVWHGISTMSRNTGATYVPTTKWMCPRKVCPTMVGKLLMYRDTSHITTQFGQWLEFDLAAAIRHATR